MYRLLLVEDEQIIKDGLTNRIDWNSVGFAVAYGASDGESALLAVDGGLEFDAVLTDIRMEPMDGLELLRALRERGFDVPVVLFSGYDDFKYAQKAIEYKALHYLLKPSTNQEILKTFAHVRELLDNSHAEQARQEALMAASARDMFMRASRQLERLINGDDPDTGGGLPGAGQAYCFLVQIGQLGASDYIGIEDFAALPCEYGVFTLRGCVRMKAGRFCLIVTASEKTVEAEQLEVMRLQLTQAVRHMLKQTVQEEAYRKLTTAMNPANGDPAALRENLAGAERLIDLRFFYGDDRHYEPEDAARHISTRIVCEAAAALNELQSAAAGSDMMLATSRAASYLHLLQSSSESTGELMHSLASAWLCLVAQLRTSDIEGALIEFGIDFMEELKSIMDYGHVSDAIDWLGAGVQMLMRRKNEWSQHDRNRDAIERVAGYIRKNLSAQLTLSDMAGTEFMSATYFGILFKRYTGTTFVRFVMNERVQLAKYCLASGMRVYEAAERVGYTDHRYFSRIFQRMTGMKPKEYRKALLSDEP